jgi:hypothetical protein
MRLKIKTSQLDLLLKLYKPKFPIQFDGKTGPIVNKILKKHLPL